MSQPWLDDIRRRRLVNAELLLEEPLGGADGVIALVVGAYDERPVHTRPLIHSECNWRRRGRSKMPCAMCPLASLVRQFSLALPAHGRRKKAALVVPMLHTNIVYKKYSNIHNYLNEINWSYREGGVSRRWGCYMWCIVDGLKLYTARRLTRRMSNLNFFLLGIHSRPAVRLSFKCKLRGHHPSARDQSFSYQSINQAKPSSLCFISARSTVINGGRGRNWKRGRCWSSMGAQNLLELI